MTLKQLANIYSGKIEILLDKSFGELENFKIEASSSDIKYLDIKDNEISKICDMVNDNDEKVKVRLSNIKNFSQDVLTIKTLVDVLGNVNHKDYVEQSLYIRCFTPNSWCNIEIINFGRVDHYLDKKIVKIHRLDSGLAIYIEKEEEQDV